MKRIAPAVRRHWSFEHTCHGCLDITDREDESRIREARLRENFAWLNRFSLSLLKPHSEGKILAMQRRRCGWNFDTLLKVLYAQRTECVLALGASPLSQLLGIQSENPETDIGRIPNILTFGREPVHRVGVIICHDILFPEVVQEARASDFLVHISNEGIVRSSLIKRRVTACGCTHNTDSPVATGL